MRKQRAFARLTEAEIDQIAEWLRHDTYEVVLERLRKPRPEGFGLTLSRKPLELLHDKRNTVDKINQKVLAGEKLSIMEFDAITRGERPDLSETVHDAILETTHEIVMSGDNSPSQLLSLQRLADFPARAEYRDHKVRMDLHKVGMDDHRKHIANERLELSKRTFELREKESAARAAKSNSSSRSGFPREDHLGPLAKNMDGVEARAKMKFGSLNEANGLQSGGAPTSASETPIASSIPSAADNEQLTTDKTDNSVVKMGSVSEHTSSSCASCSSVEETTSAPSSVVKKNPYPCPSEQSAVKPSVSTQPHQLSPSAPVQSLESRVNAYTLDRYEEAMNGKDTLKVGKWNAWKFKSKMQWCPCGKHLPCPDHGEFPTYFWELMPDSCDYREILQRKKLPYTPPLVILREQDKRERKLAAEKELLLQLPNETERSLMLNERARSHAIRRWRAYTPRPHGVPFPDESWTEECPCGAKLPCDLHDALWSEVRYLKPWDPDYIAALQREGIPIYTPTDEERRPWLNEPSSKSDSGSERALECGGTTPPVPTAI